MQESPFQPNQYISVLTGDKRLSCLICGSTFPSLFDLREHVKNPCRNAFSNKLCVGSQPLSRSSDYSYPYTPGQPVFPSSSMTRNVFNNTQKPVTAVISPEAAISIVQNDEIVAYSECENGGNDTNEVVIQDQPTQPKNIWNLLQCLQHVSENETDLTEETRANLEADNGQDVSNPVDNHSIIIDNYAAENTLRGPEDSGGGGDICVSPNIIESEYASSYEPDAKKRRLSSSVSPRTTPPGHKSQVTKELILGLMLIDADDVLANLRIISKEPFVIGRERFYIEDDRESVYLDATTGKVCSSVDDKEVLSEKKLIRAINDGRESEEFLHELGSETLQWFRSFSSQSLSTPLTHTNVRNDELGDSKSLGHPLDILATSAVERSKLESAEREAATSHKHHKTNTFSVISQSIISTFQSKISVKPFTSPDITEHLSSMSSRVRDLHDYWQHNSNEAEHLTFLILGKFILNTIAKVHRDAESLTLLIDDALESLPWVSVKTTYVPSTVDNNQDSTLNYNSQLPTKSSPNREKVLIANIDRSNRTVTLPARLPSVNVGKAQKTSSTNPAQEATTPVLDSSKEYSSASKDLLNELITQQQEAYSGSSSVLSISRTDVCPPSTQNAGQLTDVEVTSLPQTQIHGGSSESNMSCSKLDNEQPITYQQSDDVPVTLNNPDVLAGNNGDHVESCHLSEEVSIPVDDDNVIHCIDENGQEIIVLSYDTVEMSIE